MQCSATSGEVGAGPALKGFLQRSVSASCWCLAVRGACIAPTHAHGPTRATSTQHTQLPAPSLHSSRPHVFLFTLATRSTQTSAASQLNNLHAATCWHWNDASIQHAHNARCRHACLSPHAFGKNGCLCRHHAHTAPPHTAHDTANTNARLLRSGPVVTVIHQKHEEVAFVAAAQPHLAV